MTTLSVPVGPDDRALGPVDASVTLVEYGRYDCPHCLQSLSIVENLIERFGAQLRFVYRHYPIEGPHSESERAAQAAEAAGAQGKFWQMHAHLLQNQESLDDASLLAHATMLGLDIQEFSADLDSGAFEERVRRQFESGRDSGVHSTPTFFVNGIRHDDYWDIDTLSEAIESALRSTIAVTSKAA